MCIPQSYSPVLLFFIAFVGMLVCKYAFGGSALVVAVLPAIGLITGKIYQINILTRSLYSFVTNYVTGVLSAILIFAAVMAVCCVLSFVLYRKNYLKALGKNV